MGRDMFERVVVWLVDLVGEEDFFSRSRQGIFGLLGIDGYG